jgi:hypothetical protein
MEAFSRLWGSLLAFVYHCFDRLVIQGYLPLLCRPEHIVHFNRDVHGIEPITKELLRKRTQEYQQWVEAFARKQKIPIEWAQRGVDKEDWVRPHGEAMKRRKRFGVYFILKSMERGPTFRCASPKYPTKDPNYRIIRRRWSQYTHYYFYIRDEVLGNLLVCVGSFLPFQTTYYLNGHQFIEGELRRQGIAFRTDDNAVVWVADPDALQTAADGLSEKIIRRRLDYWTLIVAPKFSKMERSQINLRRDYSINQAEYCRNFVFKRHFPIHKIFERSCDLGLFRMNADKVAQIFGWRITRKVRGKLQSVLEKLDHGHHVFRAYCKSALVRMYEKLSIFLRIEVCSNRLRDFNLNKGLDNLEAVRTTLAAVTDRCAAFEAQALNTQFDFPLLERLALPISQGKTKIPGIKIQDRRMIRLLEVLLHAGTLITGWPSRDIHRAVLEAFALSEQDYTITQLRYDLRKLKAHGLLQRQGSRYRYQLTDKGARVALMFTLFHKRICGPLANSLFGRRPTHADQVPTKIQSAYNRADAAIQNLLDLLAA